jgi:hypothetical protein
VGYFDFRDNRNNADAPTSPSVMPTTANMPGVKDSPAKRKEKRHPYKNNQRKATSALIAKTNASESFLDLSIDITINDGQIQSSSLLPFQTTSLLAFR